MKTKEFEAQFISSIQEIDPQAWDGLHANHYPFYQHAFFQALENSGSIDGPNCSQTGWAPKYLLVTKDDVIVASMPLFVKTQSYGEYVFDWTWADAYHQHGLHYYPKLINAIPFTPSTGPRWAISAQLDNDQKTMCEQFIAHTLKELLRQENFSSVHCLFPSSDTIFQSADFHQRQGYQYHWFNQDYINFDAFLAQFSSRKRKNVKKERQKVQAENLTIQMRDATELPEKIWDDFYLLYHTTYLKRSGSAGYLGPQFFHSLADAMPKQILLASAELDGQLIAAAFYLRDDSTLYGRYWGARKEIDGLHFECCYYQGIEYAIKHGLSRFDPGAQGEHKIQRGFTPIKTQSFHFLRHEGFHNAVGDFVLNEKNHVDDYLKEARQSVPFKDTHELVAEDILFNNKTIL